MTPPIGIQNDSAATQEYPDVLAIVANYLVASGVVDDRVFIDSAPKGYEALNYIVVKGGNGRFSRNTPVEHSRVQLDCYGIGANAANARYIMLRATLAMHGALNSATDFGVLVLADKSGGGSAIQVPPGVRPFIPAYFNVIVKP